MYTDRLQNLVRRQGRAFAGALLLVGIVCVRNWVVTPHLACLQASQQYESVTTQSIKKSKTVNHELLAQRTRLEQLVAQYASLSGMAFSPAGAEEFLDGLAAFCEQSGCVVASLTFLNSEDRKDGDAGLSIVAKGAALTVHGAYGNITRLIDRLQVRREEVWIDELRITRLAPDSSQVVCHLAIAIYVNLDEENVDHENGPIHD